MGSDLVTPHHLDPARRRLRPPVDAAPGADQRESLRLQYALRQRARALGLA
jgi:hypothetical protein